jgi:hypothetical protein
MGHAGRQTWWCVPGLTDDTTVPGCHRHQGKKPIWQPERIVIAGDTVSPAEAWLRDFTHEYSRLIGGEADLEQLADWAIERYPGNDDRDPR